MDNTMSDEKLPPLPDAALTFERVGAYTADQMRAYAARAILALKAEQSTARGEPLVVGYFAYSSEMGFEKVESKEKAIEACNELLTQCRNDAINDSEWPDEAESICWGAILGRSIEIDTSDGETESVDYRMDTHRPPAQAVEQPKQKSLAFQYRSEQIQKQMQEVYNVFEKKLSPENNTPEIS